MKKTSGNFQSSPTVGPLPLTSLRLRSFMIGFNVASLRIQKRE